MATHNPATLDELQTSLNMIKDTRYRENNTEGIPTVYTKATPEELAAALGVTLKRVKNTILPKLRSIGKAKGFSIPARKAGAKVDAAVDAWGDQMATEMAEDDFS